MRISKINEKATIPTYGTEHSAGADLYACTDDIIIINPFETKMIHTGICMEINQGLVGLVYARSGLATKQGLAPANKVGVIDSDYRGEIMVPLYNHTNEVKHISNGDRIAQIIFTPYIRENFEVVENLTETDRGNKGFGSTGK